jgi:predicted aldo/keto reductase-like oxidoreductase
MSPKQSVASICKKCGVCEKHCPQKIKISAELVNVSKRLEPFWLKTGVGIARKFLVKK